MSLLQRARAAKHYAMLGSRELQKRSEMARARGLRMIGRFRQLPADLDRFRGEDGFFPFSFFLHEEGLLPLRPQPAPVPRTIFAYWSGDAPMSDNRLRGLQSIRENAGGAEVVLLDDLSFREYEVDEHPIHSAFPQLSAVHRSDYVRTYLMHHHGGAYTDVKRSGAGWGDAFTMLSDPEVWAVGYPEPSPGGMAPVGGRIGEALRANYWRFIGNCAYAVRPGTPLTSEWLTETECRLDYFAARLRAHPANGERTGGPQYPVPWSSLLGQVFHPLQIKHASHIRQLPSLTPVLTGYI